MSERPRKIISDKTRDTPSKIVRVITYEADCWCCDGATNKECFCIKAERYANCRHCDGRGRYRFKHSETQTKARCVGGPFDGQIVARPGDEYAQFNRGNYWSKEEPPKILWVHKDVFWKD